MRRLRYQVATSLDGYIAGPNGEFDWIIMDPDIDFAALYAQFDTVVMGRKTFLITIQQGGSGAMPGLDVVVYSKTLRPADYPAVSILSSDPAESVRSLKAKPGKDCATSSGGFSVLHIARIKAALAIALERKQPRYGQPEVSR